MQRQIQQSRGPRSLGLIVVGALAVAVLGGMLLTHATIPDAMMWDWHAGMWNGGHMAGWGAWGWTMALFGVLAMALVFGLPLYLVYQLTERSRTAPVEDGALAVLREQYARGEIDEDEYEQRRRRLQADR